MNCPKPLVGNINNFQCECPVDFFSTEEGECLECIENCKKCPKGQSLCESCKEPFLLDESNCVKECPAGKIINQLERSCEGNLGL